MPLDLFALSNVIESALRWDTDYPQQNDLYKEFHPVEHLEHFQTLADKWEAMANLCLYLKPLVGPQQSEQLEGIRHECADAEGDFRHQATEILFERIKHLEGESLQDILDQINDIGPNKWYGLVDGDYTKVQTFGPITGQVKKLLGLGNETRDLVSWDTRHTNSANHTFLMRECYDANDGDEQCHRFWIYTWDAL